MPRTSAAIPEDLNLLLQGAVQAEIFTSKSSAVEEILQDTFESDEAMRFAAVSGFYSLSQKNKGEFDVTKKELIRLAALSDKLLQQDLAKRLDMELQLQDSSSEPNTFLGEIKKSIPNDLDQEE